MSSQCCLFYFLIWIWDFPGSWYEKVFWIVSWTFRVLRHETASGTYLNILICQAVTLLRFRTHILTHSGGLWFKRQSQFRGLHHALLICPTCALPRGQPETCVILALLSNLLPCWFWSISLGGSPRTLFIELKGSFLELPLLYNLPPGLCLGRAGYCLFCSSLSTGWSWSSGLLTSLCGCCTSGMEKEAPLADRFLPTTSSDRAAEGKVLPPQCKQGVTHGELTTASTAARSTGGQRMAAFSLSLPGVGRYSQAFLGLFCVWVSGISSSQACLKTRRQHTHTHTHNSSLGYSPTPKSLAIHPPSSNCQSLPVISAFCMLSRVFSCNQQE